MKTYEIKTKFDFDKFTAKILNFIREVESKTGTFPKMNFVVKEYRKDKTPKQLRFYWVVIEEMRKGFFNAGYEYTKEEVHEFVKKAHGYTQEVVDKNGNITHITKSIGHKSEDVNIKVMMDLIDFCIRWSAINLDWTIEDPRKD